MKLSLLTFLICCSLSLTAQTGKREISVSQRIVGISEDENLYFGASLTYFRHTGRFASVGVRSSYSALSSNYLRSAAGFRKNAGTLDVLLRVSTNKANKFVFNSIIGVGLQRTNNLTQRKDFFSSLPISTGNYGYAIMPGTVFGANLAINLFPGITCGFEANLDVFQDRNSRFDKTNRTLSFGTFAAFRW